MPGGSTPPCHGRRQGDVAVDDSSGIGDFGDGFTSVATGGIGLKLWEPMRTNSNWANVVYMVLLILVVVFIFDTISNSLRSRLIGTRT